MGIRIEMNYKYLHLNIPKGKTFNKHSPYCSTKFTHNKISQFNSEFVHFVLSLQTPSVLFIWCET